jgi:hypothetical protein
MSKRTLDVDGTRTRHRLRSTRTGVARFIDISRCRAVRGNECVASSNLIEHRVDAVSRVTHRCQGDTDALV